MSCIIVRVEKLVWHRHPIQYSIKQYGGARTAALSWFEDRGSGVWCVAYLRIPIYVDNRYLAMVWPRPVAFWVEFCASEPLAWVDFFLILCNSSCNQNCTNTSIVAGVFDLYIRENWYKKYRIAHACSRSKAPQQEIQLRLNTSGNATESVRSQRPI